MASHITKFSSSANLWLGDGTAFDGRHLFSSKRPIVVFDSGVGGLTVTRKLEQLAPDASILYVADNDWFPYGSKPGSAVAERVQQLLDQLCDQVHPLAIVVACNTASIAIIEHRLDKLIKRCILVTPPIGDALKASDNKNIVLLATPGTIKSKYISKAIDHVRAQAQIWPVATQLLVTLSEAKLAGRVTSFVRFADFIDGHLTKKQRLSIDTAILGCTHFPHLISDLRKIFPSVENWIDPAEKIALEVASIEKTKSSPINLPIKAVTFTAKQGATEYQQIFWKNGFSAM